MTKGKDTPVQWHEDLPPELNVLSHNLYDRAGHYFISTYEEWERSLCCDQVPERELGVWDTIARALESYVAQYHPAGVSKTKGDKLVTALVGFTIFGCVTSDITGYVGAAAAHNLLLHYRQAQAADGPDATATE